MCLRIVVLALACALAPVLAAAQDPSTPTPTPTPTPAPAQTPPPDQPEQSDPDLRVDALQPDFNLAALPTTLRMPVHKFSFRVTHRFTRPLGEGDFGDLANDFFGFDSAAQIGLELRYGLARGTQIGVYRTSDRDTQIFGQHSLFNERDGAPLGMDIMATLEGEDNLSEHFQSTLGVLMSRNVAGRLAVYGEPLFVINSNPFEDVGANNNTLMLGLGARLRVRPGTYLVGEIHTPSRVVRSREESDQLRGRRARRRSPVPDQFLEWFRHDAGADLARRVHLQQLVHRVQHCAKILLTISASREDRR